MSVNTAHANGGVLLHYGEYILLHSEKVTMEFFGQDQPEFRDSKRGSIFLTSHRVVFINKKSDDLMQSFSAPLVVLSDVELEQPIFGANYIKGKVRAQPNGNFVGEVKFKLLFKAGGAIEYGQALLRAASLAQRNLHQGGMPGDQPPPYTPAGAWHEAPPPAYEPPPGYYGWLPAHDAFTRPTGVFMGDNPPPYPGIGGPPAYTPQGQYGPGQPQYGPQPGQPQYGPQPGQYGPQPGQPQYGPQPGQYGPQPTQPHYPPPQQQNDGGVPSWNGFSLPPDQQQQQQQQPQQPNPYGPPGNYGFSQPGAPGGYPGAPPQYGGYPGYTPADTYPQKQ